MNILYKWRKKYFYRKNQKDKFYNKKIKNVNFKDVNIIRKFLTENGKLLPSKLTNINYFYQRKLKNAVKIARYLSLIPYISKYKI